MTDWPLVGREAEIERAFHRLEQDPPVAVVIAGAAGVGKSRLAREIVARAVERGWSADIVVGMRAAASIPFGALAPIIREPTAEASHVGMLAEVRRRLTGAGATHLLVVDDAQRLDPATATLIHQVVAERLCRTVVTVRTGEPASDTITTLWTGGLAEYRELTGLTRAQTGELLGAFLGGLVDGATRHRLWHASGGNVLYLRELVLGAIADGSLGHDGGVWRWRGPARLPLRLVELIQRRLDTLDAKARSALDVLAFAERIDLDQVSRLTDAGALERLEGEGLVEVIDDGDGPMIALAHPLYGEAVRAAMPVLRQRRVAAEVADVVEAAGLSRPSDAVRVATWRLDAGQPVDPDLLTTAARRAYIANDYPLADRLGAAARRAGGGVPAGLVLAESAIIAGRHEEAATLLAELADEAATDKERVDVADSRALVLGLYLGREDEAVAVVEDTLAAVTDAAVVDPLRASLSIVLAQVPRPLAAVEAVRPLLDDPEGSCFYRATYAASIALATCGRLDETVAVGRRGFDAHAALGTAVRFLAEAQFIGASLGLLAAGRPDESAELVSRGYEAAVAAGDHDLQAAFALYAGRIGVHRGRLTTAEHHFREAAAIYQELNDVASLRWALGGSALAAGMGSQRADSAAVVAEIDGLVPAPVQLFELDLVERGRAWAAAAAGAMSQAASVLRSAADRAAGTGQPVVEALLRHDLSRLGEARAEHARLVELAGLVDGELVPTLAEHAGALVSKSAAALESSAVRLADLGAALVGYEAATDAAAAWRADGFRRRAAGCEDLARRLTADCEGARSPVAHGDVLSAALTGREREVATLAADGLTSREIADKLNLSHRTVENHLQRVYDKLGVSNRQDLAEVLGR